MNGHFRSAKSPIAMSRSSSASPVTSRSRSGAARIAAAQASPSAGSARRCLGIGDEGIHDRGIELSAAPAARHRDSTFDAVEPLVHLRQVGELGDAHLDRDLLPGASAGIPPPS